MPDTINMDPNDPLSGDIRADFIAAAWGYVDENLGAHGCVPDAMLLGIYETVDMVLAQPTSQDTDVFKAATAALAEQHKCDLAIMIGQGTMGDSETPDDQTPVVTVFWRERDGEIHVEYAHLVMNPDGSASARGPVSSQTDVQTNAYLDEVFGPAQRH
jgi:hypothetical protein